MRAVTFQMPGEVRLEEKPEPEPIEPDDAVVTVEAAGVCGSDLHIYHGRHPGRAGLHDRPRVRRHVTAAGDAVDGVAEGDRVIGSFVTACGECYFCRLGLFHHCEQQRIFGHGEISGRLPGAQAEQVLVPHANLVLRHAPDGLADDAALFAGDVMNTGYFGVKQSGLKEGETAAVLGLGPVGLCAVQAARRAGAAEVIAIDSVPERLEMARRFGATPVHLTEQDPRAEVKAATEGRGVDVCVEAVGSAQALDMAVRLARRVGRISMLGVHGKPCEVHMGLVWNKG